jgi:hypothetical protein
MSRRSVAGGEMMAGLCFRGGGAVSNIFQDSVGLHGSRLVDAKGVGFGRGGGGVRKGQLYGVEAMLLAGDDLQFLGDKLTAYVRYRYAAYPSMNVSMINFLPYAAVLNCLNITWFVSSSAGRVLSEQGAEMLRSSSVMIMGSAYVRHPVNPIEPPTLKEAVLMVYTKFLDQPHELREVEVEMMDGADQIRAAMAAGRSLIVQRKYFRAIRYTVYRAVRSNELNVPFSYLKIEPGWGATTHTKVYRHSGGELFDLAGKLAVQIGFENDPEYTTTGSMVDNGDRNTTRNRLFVLEPVGHRSRREQEKSRREQEKSDRALALEMRARDIATREQEQSDAFFAHDLHKQERLARDRAAGAEPAAEAAAEADETAAEAWERYRAAEADQPAERRRGHRVAEAWERYQAADAAAAEAWERRRGHRAAEADEPAAEADEPAAEPDEAERRRRQQEFERERLRQYDALHW